MPLAWEYNISISNDELRKAMGGIQINAPSHVCGTNPIYSRYYKLCWHCVFRKAKFRLKQPNLNQRSLIRYPCISGVGEFTYAQNSGYVQRPKLKLGLLEF